MAKKTASRNYSSAPSRPHSDDSLDVCQSSISSNPSTREYSSSTAERSQNGFSEFSREPPTESVDSLERTPQDAQPLPKISDFLKCFDELKESAQWGELSHDQEAVLKGAKEAIAHFAACIEEIEKHR